MADFNSYCYGLAPWRARNKSLRCPSCGATHGAYKEYVNLQTGLPVDPVNHTCGRCDHEQSCGYHLTPKEYFAQNGKHLNSAMPYTAKKETQRKRIEIPMEMVAATLRNTLRNGNTLTRWLWSLPLTDKERYEFLSVLQFYAVGTSRDGRVIWWQMDEQFVIRTGKIMLYGQDGHRVKDARGESIGFSWAHSQLRKKGYFLPENDYDLLQCLFGQHLLKMFPNAEVHLVESEKTAIFMALIDDKAFTQNIWLATGGLQNLRPSTFITLANRKVICYPDLDGIDKWKQRIEESVHKNIHLYTDWARHLSPSASSKSDIADMILSKLYLRTPSEIHAPFSPTQTAKQEPPQQAEPVQPPVQKDTISPPLPTAQTDNRPSESPPSHLLSNPNVSRLIDILQLTPINQ